MAATTFNLAQSVEQLRRLNFSYWPVTQIGDDEIQQPLLLMKSFCIIALKLEFLQELGTYDAEGV
ncbi:hypothetical protein HU675_0007690 [Bradyrhizobium septentrionale]|nr:hypothetical protein [Bradyrhizobium septentrionale]UGY26639.1 hypothetical protein HU675_0007690 [Bradyrhizobium septentrionale]